MPSHMCDLVRAAPWDRRPLLEKPVADCAHPYRGLARKRNKSND